MRDQQLCIVLICGYKLNYYLANHEFQSDLGSHSVASCMGSGIVRIEPTSFPGLEFVKGVPKQGLVGFVS